MDVRMHGRLDEDRESGTSGGDEPDLEASRPDVVVVGAGIAGLSAALTLQRNGRSVLVLDGHPAGGRARTEERDGFLHNVGPHAVYCSGAFAALLERHRIDWSGGVPGRGRTLVARDGAFTALSMEPWSLLRTPLLGRRDRVRLLALFARVQRARSHALVGTSLAEWLAGIPDPVRQFAEMFARVSTYTDAPDLVDAGATLAQMQMALGAGVSYPDEGWGSIVEAMVARLSGRADSATVPASVRTGVAVLSVEAAGDRRLVVRTDHGDVRARGVVVAAGGPAVTERLVGASVAGVERLTPPVTAGALDLAVNEADVVAAFALDEPLYLSAHAPVARLAPEGAGLVSVLRYHRPGVAPAEPAEERARLRAYAARAGISVDDVAHERYLHRVVVSHGAPSAAGGGLAGRPGVDALGVPGVMIAGDWVGDRGWLADAAAASGVAAAEALVAESATLAR